MRKIKVEEVIKKMELKDATGYLCLVRLVQHANVLAIGKNLTMSSIITQTTCEETLEKTFKSKKRTVVVFREVPVTAHKYFDEQARKLCKEPAKKVKYEQKPETMLRGLEKQIYNKIKPLISKTLEDTFKCKDSVSKCDECDKFRICDFCYRLCDLIKENHAVIQSEIEANTKAKVKKKREETKQKKKEKEKEKAKTKKEVNQSE
jgi:hypothetical protein